MGNNRIAYFRRESGMNQKELGQQLGVAQTTVSAWERGINEPDNESMHKMAKLFHTTIGYLAGYEAESYKRGLSDREFDEYQKVLAVQREQEEIEREIKAREAETQALDEEEIEAFERYEYYQKWQNGEKAQTLEGYIVATLVDDQDVERRKWLLETVRQLIKAPK